MDIEDFSVLTSTAFTRIVKLKALPLKVCGKRLSILIWGMLISGLPAQDLRDFGRATAHNQGNLQTVLFNSGGFGDQFLSAVDPITGESIYGLTFPRSSGIRWGNINPVIGGIKGRDTLATYLELLPDLPPDNEFRYESIDVASSLHNSGAHSIFDILCTYNDSITDPRYLPGHRPLGVRVQQRSMAWGGLGTSNFILVDMEISSMTDTVLRRVFCGLFGGGSILNGIEFPSSPLTVFGSLRTIQSVGTCDTADETGVYYWMSGSGDPENYNWTPQSVLGAMSIVPLGSPGDSLRVSFNWFASNLYGEIHYVSSPKKKSDTWKYRGDAVGAPSTDADRYFLLSNGYDPYDQWEMALNHEDAGWQPPRPEAPEIAGGSDGLMTVGVGPFDLGPGQKVHFTYAIVGGENVHVNPTDFANYWDPYHPEVYYSKLDFSELMTNARTAKWVYDNPGVDTDGDGFFGKFRVCDGDTNWYEGDGVPDFRADVPPPSPKLKVHPSLNSLTLRWNGYYSENAIDPFTKIKDFEGYRVYLGLDDRESSFSTLISWDYPNYNRYYLREKPNHTFVWETKDLPFTIDSLQSLYGSDFYPLRYTKDNPLHVGDTQYSFSAVDYNLSSLISNGVHKVYPEALNPGTDTTLWTEDQLTTEHGTPLPKYYEYEYTIDNLLPTIPYYLSVTSFDFGFAKGNIPAKESSKRENQTVAYAQTSAETVWAENLNVYVYPNPYIWQKDYHSLGYENRDNTQIPNRSHRINFGNLPPRCKISIFSLDGDLIRSWDHNHDPGDPQAMHDAWDLITRNTMLPVAGLYYWVVESDGRTQIGKFVIVM